MFSTAHCRAWVLNFQLKLGRSDVLSLRTVSSAWWPSPSSFRHVLHNPLCFRVFLTFQIEDLYHYLKFLILSIFSQSTPSNRMSIKLFFLGPFLYLFYILHLDMFCFFLPPPHILVLKRIACGSLYASLIKLFHLTWLFPSFDIQPQLTTFICASWTRGRWTLFSHFVMGKGR